MSPVISYESFLVTESFQGFEDPEKFKKYLPKLEKYKNDLKESILDEYKVAMPKPIDELVKDQLDAVDYMYKEKLLTPEEFEITDSTASKIVKNIGDGKWTAVQVLKALHTVELLPISSPIAPIKYLLMKVSNVLRNWTSTKRKPVSW